ncbi:MAG: hypothetical protein ACJAR2_000161 [Ilumatobacter sp.]|jgi:hypothetical protein
MTVATSPNPGEFFDPDPSTINDPANVQSLGRARVELLRLGTKKYQMRQRVGYQDPKTSENFIIPRHLTWTCDLSSNPVVFSWVIPVLGNHFNAILLHDCLVEHATEGVQGTDYIGTKVTREEVDRITRDAMHELGTGFVRRWMAWVGMTAGTIFSKQSLGDGSRQLFFMTLLAAHVLAIVILGVLATGDLLDAWAVYPWMGGRGFFAQFATASLASLVIPAAMSLLWWKRWRFGLVLGLILGPLLPAILTTAALSALYVVAELFFSRLLKLAKKEKEALPPDGV